MGLKRPLWRVNRSKGEQIYHKDGCCRVPSTRSLEQHPTFCGQDFLDIQVWLSYTHFQRKQGLIKDIIPFPSILVGSESDNHMTLETARKMAADWNSCFVNAGTVGHINLDSGHGPWPQGEALLQDLIKTTM